MLTQAEVDSLLNMLKKLKNEGSFEFPCFGVCKQLELDGIGNKEKFIIDINRKGRIKISKCTFTERYRKDEILLRLDIDGPPHTNPDGVEIFSNHLHIYKEGFEDRYAIPIPNTIFTDSTDLVKTLIEFLQYCKVINVDRLFIQGGMF